MSISSQTKIVPKKKSSSLIIIIIISIFLAIAAISYFYLYSKFIPTQKQLQSNTPTITPGFSLISTAENFHQIVKNSTFSSTDFPDNLPFTKFFLNPPSTSPTLAYFTTPPSPVINISDNYYYTDSAGALTSQKDYLQVNLTSQSPLLSRQLDRIASFDNHQLSLYSLSPLLLNWRRDLTLDYRFLGVVLTDTSLTTLITKDLGEDSSCPISPLPQLSISCSDLAYISSGNDHSQLFIFIQFSLQTGSIEHTLSIIGPSSSYFFITPSKIYVASDISTPPLQVLTDFLTQQSTGIDFQSVLNLDISTKAKIEEISSRFYTANPNVPPDTLSSDFQVYLDSSDTAILQTLLYQIDLQNLALSQSKPLSGLLLDPKNLILTPTSLNIFTSIVPQSFSFSQPKSFLTQQKLSTNEITTLNLDPGPLSQKAFIFSDRAFISPQSSSSSWQQIITELQPPLLLPINLPTPLTSLHQLLGNLFISLGSDSSRMQISLLDSSYRNAPKIVSQLQFADSLENSASVFFYRDTSHLTFLVIGQKQTYLISFAEAHLTLLDSWPTSLPSYPIFQDDYLTIFSPQIPSRFSFIANQGIL